MEKKMKTKHHNKHGQQLHKPLGAYELYELEHMPHNLVKLQSDRPKPRTHETFRTDYYATGRDMQPCWDPPGGNDGEFFMPDHYETGRTVQPYGPPPDSDDKENVDAEAEKFIMLEHEKFKLSKWMSMNTK